MPEDRDALLQHYHQSRQQFLAVVAGLSNDQLTETTIDGWSAKDHMAHLALWDEIRAQEVQRISAGWESAWRVEGRDEEIQPLFHDMRANLSLDQVRWEFATSRERLLEAIAAASDRAMDGSLYGEAGLKSSHELMHAYWIKQWRDSRGY